MNPDEIEKPDPAGDMSRRAFIRQTGLTTVALMAIPASLSASSNRTSEPTEILDMPLVRIDAFEGRNESEIKTLLDAAHRAIVKAFHLNERDRYQIFNARPKSRFVMQDTGLGIPRTDKALIITVVSKQRPGILKRRLYKEMTDELSRTASIPPSDVMICVIENSGGDWTFGNGEAQFLTGDLG